MNEKRMRVTRLDAEGNPVGDSQVVGTVRDFALPESPDPVSEHGPAHEHGDWDQGGYCNRLVLDEDGYADVCGYLSLGAIYKANALQSVSMETTFNEVSPDLMSLLTGQSAKDRAAQGPQSYALEVFRRVPVRRRAWRVVWEWIRRTPRQYTESVYAIPKAQVSGNPDGSMTVRPSPQDWGINPYQKESDTP